jgi:hypothetical protein
MAGCLGKRKKRHPLGATQAGSSPICLKERFGATSWKIAWQPMSALGGRSSPGPRPQASIPSPFFPTALEAYRFLGEEKNAASLKQIRAALSFAYRHWDLKNPFSKIDPPIQKEPQIRYLLLADIRRLLAYLSAHQQGYSSALALPPCQRPLPDRVPVR